MSDSSKNKDNSSDGGDEAKKMVLRSATNSIRNKKWSEEDVEEAEYEGDSDGEDTDYGNSRRGEPRAKETRKGGRASARQTNAHYNTRSRNPRSTRKETVDQEDSFEEAEPKSVSTSASKKRTRASIESKPQDSAGNGSDESAFEDAAVSSLLGLAEASIFLLDQREPKRQKTESTKEAKKGADSTRSPDQSFVTPTKGREEKKKPAQSPTSPTATTPVKQQPQGEELYDYETARSYVTAPPHFTALKGNASSLKNINPNITFNGRQRTYRRCSTHVAIAYYIFYHQKYSFLSAPPNVNYTQKYLQPISLDPTYEARVAKERSEHFRRLMAQQQQQSAMMPSYPPPPPYGHPALTAMPQMMQVTGPMPGYPMAPPMAPMYSTAPNPAFPYMQSAPQPTMLPNLGVEPKLETGQVPLPPIKTEDDANKLSNNNILPSLSSLDIDRSLLSPKKEVPVSPMKPREENPSLTNDATNNVNTNEAKND